MTPFLQLDPVTIQLCLKILRAKKDKRKRRSLPAEPLAKEVWIQEQLFPDGRVGLARSIAARLGANELTIIRGLERLIQPGAHVHERTAERLCVGMGKLPGEIWGWDYERRAA